jgi:hypothetical protein
VANRILSQLKAAAECPKLSVVMPTRCKVIHPTEACLACEIVLYCASGSPCGQVSTMLANSSNGSLLIALSAKEASFGRVSVGGEARIEKLLSSSCDAVA